MEKVLIIDHSTEPLVSLDAPLPNDNNMRSYVELDEEPGASMLQHNSGPVGISAPTTGAPMWAQPGYVANTYDPNSGVIEVSYTPEHSFQESEARPQVVDKQERNGEGNSSSFKRHVQLGAKENVDLDYTTPRVSVTETSRLVKSTHEHDEPCCPCIIL